MKLGDQRGEGHIDDVAAVIVETVPSITVAMIHTRSRGET